MDVNGESMARRWQKEILFHGLITVVRWPLDAPFANKYVYITFVFNNKMHISRGGPEHNELKHRYRTPKFLKKIYIRKSP